jgi:hypothetical protein
MNSRKLRSVVFSILLGCAVFLPLARAGMWNQQTEVTFDHPVEIPGCVLLAGSYWFIQDSDNSNVVRVFSLDWKTIYATEQTAETLSREPAEYSTFTLARQESKPEALVSWIYPGETTGHEFLYPKRERKELAQDAKLVVVAPRAGSPPKPGL